MSLGEEPGGPLGRSPKGREAEGGGRDQVGERAVKSMLIKKNTKNVIVVDLFGCLNGKENPISVFPEKELRPISTFMCL